MTSIPTIKLNDGNAIPQLGFGVFQIEAEETVEAVNRALEIGYRHIDTAEMYENEREVGEAVRASGLPREEIWITSKLNNGAHEPDEARRAFEATLEALDLGHVDLFLIHWPLPTKYDGDFVATWRAVAELTEDGRLTSAGVSNFEPEHLNRIVDETGVVPVVNQIEVHPYFTNEAARAASLDRDIRVEAWSPIARGNVLDDPVITEIADVH